MTRRPRNSRANFIGTASKQKQQLLAASSNTSTAPVTSAAPAAPAAPAVSVASVAAAAATSSKPATADAQWISIGTLRRAHGIRGGVHVSTWNADSELLEEEGLVVRLVAGQKTMTTSVLSCYGPGLVQFANINDRTQADLWRNADVQVRRDDFDDIDDDTEVYLIDLIGARVENQHGKVYGTIRAFVDNVAQMLAEVVPVPNPNKNAVAVQPDPNTKKKPKKAAPKDDVVLLPFVPGIVVGADPRKKIVVVDAPIGLFEGDAEEVQASPEDQAGTLDDENNAVADENSDGDAGETKTARRPFRRFGRRPPSKS